MQVARTSWLTAGWILLLRLHSPTAGAADFPAAAEAAESFAVPQLFERGRCELTLGGGAMLSPIGLPRNRPVINYSMTDLQLGYMLGDVKGAGWWRGNFELVGEAFGSAIFEGPGSYLAGGTLWLRYNFVPSTWRLTPYLQAGAGLVTTDIDRGLVGQPFNFNLSASLGLRYFLSRHWSIEAEYRFQHISNADLGRKNIGINAQGPILGVSYFF